VLLLVVSAKAGDEDEDGALLLDPGVKAGAFAFMIYVMLVAEENG
jgi:hypothetical protein